MNAYFRRLFSSFSRSIAAEASVIGLVWLAGGALAWLLALPLSGGVTGFFLLLALLAAGLIKTHHIGRGAQWYIGEMLLFFIPAMVAVIDHPELAGILGAKLLVAVVAGTLIVMAATGLVVEAALRLAGDKESGQGDGP